MAERPKSGAVAILAEIMKLKSQQKYLEASQMTMNARTYVAPDEISQINELENLKVELEINLSTFERETRGQTARALDQMKTFGETMLKPSSLQQYNTRQYREQVLQVDRTLREACERNADDLKRLHDEYIDIEDELQALSNGNLMRQPQKVAPAAAKCRAMTIRQAMSAPIDRIDNEDVKQFERFVGETGGHSAGWCDEEHKLFTKLRSKYKNNVERICAELMPVLTGAIFGMKNDEKGLFFL